MNPIKNVAVALGVAFAAFSSQAATVGVTTGGYPYLSYVSGGLTSFGHTVVGLSGLTALDLAGLDAVVFGRSDAPTPDLTAFVAGGGTVITEWSGAGYGMGLLGGSAADNYSSYVTADPVVFTTAGLAAGLGTGLGGSYADSGATEFYQDFLSLGSGTLYATRGSSGAAAIVGGSYGLGYVWVNGYDWGDSGATPTFQLLHNELTATPGVPTPDAGTTVALLGLAMGGLAGLRRRVTRA